MKKLFLIERENFICQTIEKTLKNKGWQVYSFAGDEDCSYFLTDLGPDLVLLDLNSLERQGEEFFRSIADIVTQIPVVAMGFEADEKKLEEYSLIWSGFLKKPLSPSGLDAKLSLFLKE